MVHSTRKTITLDLNTLGHRGNSLSVQDINRQYYIFSYDEAIAPIVTSPNILRYVDVDITIITLSEKNNFHQIHKIHNFTFKDKRDNAIEDLMGIDRVIFKALHFTAKTDYGKSIPILKDHDATCLNIHIITTENPEELTECILPLCLFNHAGIDGFKHASNARKILGISANQYSHYPNPFITHIKLIDETPNVSDEEKHILNEAYSQHQNEWSKNNTA